MKNRKGFTLVELLAVIAILAILVIIALPNVINMYNKAQKQTFLTEARNVYREAERKFLANSISGKNTKVFNSEDSTKLDMNGKKLQYCVVLNNSGKVSDMKVSNGKWVASLNGKAIDELTIDDLEDGNLDDYECVSATDESCFAYTTFTESEEDSTLAVSIDDTTKCKNYLVSNITDMTEENATTLCNGDVYMGNNTLMSMQELVRNNTITSDNYDNAGLNVKYLMVESVDVQDSTKCKNYLQKLDLTLEEATKLCETEEGMNGFNIGIAVIIGDVPYSAYDHAGLNVTTRALGTGIAITGYNADCGTDVVIPSKIDGKNVLDIVQYAFNASCLESVNSNIDDDYKVKFLDYSFDDKYSINRLKELPKKCISKKLTSVVLPDTLLFIEKNAFARNVFTEITIPQKVRYIGDSALSNDSLTTIINNSFVENYEDTWKRIIGNECKTIKFDKNKISLSGGCQ